MGEGRDGRGERGERRDGRVEKGERGRGVKLELANEVMVKSNILLKKFPTQFACGYIWHAVTRQCHSECVHNIRSAPMHYTDCIWSWVTNCHKLSQI